MSQVLPIFVSSGRSGLTLLEMIFNSHSDIAVAHEPRFLAPMSKKLDSYQTSAGIDIDRFVTDLYSVPNFRRLGVEIDEVRVELERQQPTTLADASRVIFSLYAKSRGKTRYGDKTPLYISFIDSIAELFPEARFVHLVRDGRDTVLAYLERNKGPRTVAEGAFHWRLRVLSGRRSGTRLGSDRYMEIFYEDLVDDTEATVRAVCDFIDLDFEPGMLDYVGTSEKFLAEAKNPTDHQHLTLGPTKGLIDWRATMSDHDLALFEAIAGDALEIFGYERASQRRLSRLRVWAEWVSWQLRRVLWRLAPRKQAGGRQAVE